MPSWTLQCTACKSRFDQSKIDDVRIESYFLPAKPEFPATGLAVTCPNCGSKNTYQRSDLIYRA